MASFEYDLFVVGGGSGGVRAARIAANHGARVAIAEESRWGGTCVVRGCVPKKLLVYGSEIGALVEDARGFGWRIDGARPDWPALRDAVEREVSRLSGLYLGNLQKARVTVIDGHAKIVDPHTVLVAGVPVTAAHVSIATGGRPRRLPVQGGELAIVSDDVFRLPSLPKRMVIVGGGYIAVEFAHVFAGLGTEVVLAHRGERVLPGFDGDVRVAVEDGLRWRRIEVHRDAECARIEAPAAIGDPLRVLLTDGSPVEADVVLAAIGREPNTHGLGLAELGVAMGARGAITVDEFSRTNLPSVHAVGDVTGRQALTPIAIREGHAFADTIFGNKPTAVRHDLIPTAVFAQPPAASIGLAEDTARARGRDVAIFKTSFLPLRHRVSGREEPVLMKLVVDAESRKVLGAHVVGPDAPEIIQAAAIAITMGATKDDFDRTVALHPTLAEELVLLK